MRDATRRRKRLCDRGQYSHPEFSDRFIAHMLRRNIRIEEDLVDQLFNSSEKRLARTLLLLARYGKEGFNALQTTSTSDRRNPHTADTGDRSSSVDARDDPQLDCGYSLKPRCVLFNLLGCTVRAEVELLPQ